MLKKGLKLFIFTWLVLLIISGSFAIVSYSDENGLRLLLKEKVVIERQLKELREISSVKYSNYEVILNRQTDEIIEYISNISILEERVKFLEKNLSQGVD